MGKFALGQPVPRTEDPRLLRGEGRFADDIRLADEAHGYVLRSPHAHARVTAVDVSAALQMPGVVGALSGADWAADGHGAHGTPRLPRTRRDGSPLMGPPLPALAQDRVMHVGQPVALVVAESLAEAKDAAERIVVEYEPLPVVIKTAEARTAAAPVLWDECPDNEAFYFTQGDQAAVEDALTKAPHVTRLNLVINRVTSNTMEPRACVATYDKSEGRYVLYGGTQRPRELRGGLALNIFHVPETDVRVIAPDIGGSFGMKNGNNPDYHLLLCAAKKYGRPIRWASERSDGMVSDYHDRDQVTEAALGLDEDGKFLALKVSNICNIGAYLLPAGVISPNGHLGGLAGTYMTPRIFAEASAVYSNTPSIGPYRGSGRPEASYVLERLIDAAARELKIDRAEIRRRNSIPPGAMPFKTGLNYTYDCSEFKKNLNQALEAADYEKFEDRRAEASAQGKLRGIGMSNIIEQTAQTGGETVRLRFEPSGTLTVIPGSVSHGQGHETMYKIILSDRLGLEQEDVRVATNDTDMAPDSSGTYGSRTAILGGSATLLAADKVIEKGKKIAAHLMEAPVGDIEFGDGNFRVTGTDKSVSMREVVITAFQARRDCRRKSSPASWKPRHSIPTHQPFPTAPMSARLKSIPRPVPAKLCAIRWSTMSISGNISRPSKVSARRPTVSSASRRNFSRPNH